MQETGTADWLRRDYQAQQQVDQCIDRTGRAGFTCGTRRTRGRVWAILRTRRRWRIGFTWDLYIATQHRGRQDSQQDNAKHTSSHRGISFSRKVN